MRRSLPILAYAFLLALLPVVEVSLLSPLGAPTRFVLFFLLATAGFFMMTTRAWWLVTLVFAAWHDLIEFLPLGSTVLSTVILGLCLRELSRRLAGRSLGGDFTIVAGSVLAAAVVLALFIWVNASYEHQSVVWGNIFAEGLLLVLVALFEAWWFSPEDSRHEFVT